MRIFLHSLIKKIEYFLIGIIERLENQKMGPGVWLSGFLAIAFLRNFLETFSTNSNILSSSKWGFFFLHSVASYLFLVLCWILIIYFVTKENITKITKIVLFGATMILLVPILDLIFSQALGISSVPIHYTYLSPTATPAYLSVYLQNWLIWGGGTVLFFQNPQGGFIVPGNFNFFSLARIFALIFCLVIFWFIFKKTKMVFPAIFFLLFCFLFFSAVLIVPAIRYSGGDFLEQLIPAFGSRVSAFVALFLVLYYVLLKTKNIVKLLICLFSLYVFGFVFTTFPYIFAVILGLKPFSYSFRNISTLDPSFGWDKISFSLYFILILAMSCLWFFIYCKEKFFSVLKNLRPFRLFHNIAMMGFGFYIGIILNFGNSDMIFGIIPRNFHINFFDGLLIIMAVLSFILYWLSGVGYDDIADRKIDEISNPGRPLSSGKFSKEEFWAINNVLRLGSFGCAIAAGYEFILLMFLRSVMAHLYFAKPFRLKKIPIIATFLLSLGTLSTILGGFVLVKDKTVLDFPKDIIFFIVIAFTLGFTTKDIKDYRGDKAEGIYTIPVIFGEKRGKTIIGFLAIFAFLLPLFFFPFYFKILILPSIFAGALSFWLINKKNYSEKPLFLVYFLYGIFLALTVFKYL